MDYFSRKLDKQYYDNAIEIYNYLKKEQKYKGQFPKIQTWELYDRAFTFQRIRSYGFVAENMNHLEVFEDNANLNPTNSHAIAKFIKEANSVRANLIERYGEFFVDPATVDPYEEKPKTW